MFIDNYEYLIECCLDYIYHYFFLYFCACFVPDHNSPEANLSAHAKMWNALAPEAKEAYQKQAVDRKKNGPPPPASGQERKKRISRLLKSLNPVVSIYFFSPCSLMRNY